jgi:hypothetical protein
MFNRILKTILCSSAITLCMPLYGAMSQDEAAHIHQQATDGFYVLHQTFAASANKLLYNNELTIYSALVSVIEDINNIDTLEQLKQTVIFFKTISLELLGTTQPPQNIDSHINNGIAHMSTILDNAYAATQGSNMLSTIQEILFDMAGDNDISDDDQDSNQNTIHRKELDEICWASATLLAKINDRTSAIRMSQIWNELSDNNMQPDVIPVEFDEE